jgi:hypothetical protein
MKKDVHPGVFIGLALVALAAAILIGYRSMNSSPKLEYPKGFNPARPPGAVMGNAAQKDGVRPGAPR